ncbi:MAG TPA: c-type cytochrome [Caulobacteraceae bacterium]|nr:c-type cytochrome [Caulobacteraceae bacterium]
MALRDPSPDLLRRPPSPTRGEGSYWAIVAGAAAILAASSAFAQGNPGHGQQVFQDNCSGCHVLTGPGYAAPPLAGVYGRKAGTSPGFAYSDPMTKSGIVWDGKSLREFLADPDKVVPGTAMAFSLPGSQDRDDVVEYLKSLTPGAK